jgi:CTP synthase (UTP-ammonia lyase)
VQVVPHITDAIQDWVERVAQIPVSQSSDKRPDVCIIELGMHFLFILVQKAELLEISNLLHLLKQCVSFNSVSVMTISV